MAHIEKFVESKILYCIIMIQYAIYIRNIDPIRRKNDTLQPKKEHKHSSHYASNAEKAYNLAYLYLF